MDEYAPRRGAGASRIVSSGRAWSGVVPSRAKRGQTGWAETRWAAARVRLARRALHMSPLAARAVGRASARNLGWALTTNFAVAAVVVASTAVGQRLPTAMESDRMPGQWYRVSNTVDGVSIWPTAEPSGSGAVYVGRDRVWRTGYFAPVEEVKRVWVADPLGEARPPTIREAIRLHLASSPETREWAPALAEPSHEITRTIWWGSTIYGGAFVVPAMVSLAGMWFYGARLFEFAGRWRLARQGRCTACGYCLHNLDIDDAPHCPECGDARAVPERVQAA